MPKDTIYADRANAGYDLYCYSDGRRYFLIHFPDRHAVECYAKLHEYAVHFIR